MIAQLARPTCSRCSTPILAQLRASCAGASLTATLSADRAAAAGDAACARTRTAGRTDALLAARERSRVADRADLAGPGKSCRSRWSCSTSSADAADRRDLARACRAGRGVPLHRRRADAARRGPASAWSASRRQAPAAVPRTEHRRAAADLRRPGGDRDPERAAVQRDAGGAATPDRDQRDPAGDLRLAHRRAAGAAGGGRACGQDLRCAVRRHHPARGRDDPRRGRLRRPGRPHRRTDAAGPQHRHGPRDRRPPAGACARPAAGAGRVPARQRTGAPARPPHHAGRAAAARGPRAGLDPGAPHRGAALRRQAHRAAAHLCRPGGHRDGERAAVQRDAGSAGAAHRDGGDPEGDCQFAVGRAAGVRRHRRGRAATGRRLLVRRMAAAGRHAATRGLHRNGRRGRRSRVGPAAAGRSAAMPCSNPSCAIGWPGGSSTTRPTPKSRPTCASWPGRGAFAVRWRSPCWRTTRSSA